MKISENYTLQDIRIKYFWNMRNKDYSLNTPLKKENSEKCTWILENTPLWEEETLWKCPKVLGKTWQKFPNGGEVGGLPTWKQYPAFFFFPSKIIEWKWSEWLCPSVQCIVQQLKTIGSKAGRSSVGTSISFHLIFNQEYIANAMFILMIDMIWQ